MIRWHVGWTQYLGSEHRAEAETNKASRPRDFVSTVNLHRDRIINVTEAVSSSRQFFPHIYFCEQFVETHDVVAQHSTDGLLLDFGVELQK